MKYNYLAILFGALLPSVGFSVATLKATYLFNKTLQAEQPTAPALLAIDPLGLSAFEETTVFNRKLPVYHWAGDSVPANQAGFSLNTTGLIPTTDYSIEMAFEFLSPDGWRRILDVQDRTSDDGFYVDSNSYLSLFPVQSGIKPVITAAFHHVVLTVTAKNVVKAYLDGKPELSISTPIMNISNPSKVINFFLDNTQAGGQGEFSNGRVAWIKVYKGVLSKADVAQSYTASRSVSGKVTGLVSLGLSCFNNTTGKMVTPKPRITFDCETKGLAVSTKDKMTVVIQGEKVDANKVVKGQMAGFGTLGIQCENLTTGTLIAIENSHGTWDCEASGLGINVGDVVKVTAQGNAH